MSNTWKRPRSVDRISVILMKDLLTRPFSHSVLFCHWKFVSLGKNDDRLIRNKVWWRIRCFISKAESVSQRLSMVQWKVDLSTTTGSNHLSARIQHHEKSYPSTTDSFWLELPLNRNWYAPLVRLSWTSQQQSVGTFWFYVSSFSAQGTFDDHSKGSYGQVYESDFWFNISENDIRAGII